MPFHRDTEYALACLAEMGSKEGVYSARRLSDSCNVPYDLLCKILQQLAHAGILTSVRGPSGGYRLSHQPEEIKLSDVIEAVHRGGRKVPCLDGKHCSREGNCSIRGGVITIQSMWDDILSRVSLKEFTGMKETVSQGSFR
ncbi:MAG: Rrf2 family transcriptional regulator [Spirochaetales bacterium]|nr:Rrf2 family transcriptional regulator [Spirochaetales bacterium]